MIHTKVKINGKEYDAVIDWEVFGKYSNFDCFNCSNDCCADSPSKLRKETREFLVDNLDDFNDITKNLDITYELGYEEEDIKEELLNQETREIITDIEEQTEMCFYGYKREDRITLCGIHSLCEEEDIKEELLNQETREIITDIEEQTEMCFYGYKREDRITLCGIHSLCLNKNMDYKEVCYYKPLVCLLWPLEILSEDDNSKLYITLPDDFTNSFTIEDYYELPCINEDFSKSMLFRKRNPKGFEEEGYRPFIESYKDTLVNIFGEEFYDTVKNRLVEENYL